MEYIPEATVLTRNEIYLYYEQYDNIQDAPAKIYIFRVKYESVYRLHRFMYTKPIAYKYKYQNGIASEIKYDINSNDINFYVGLGDLWKLTEDETLDMLSEVI
jgi:hypothetical protein